MGSPLSGIHHVTAFAKSPVENMSFYTGVLGQRLVKKTVNFDDPLTYHLYYGDATGSPGTLLTHFPHPAAKRGVHGAPEIVRTVLSCAEGSLGYWEDRFGRNGVAAVRGDVGGDAGLVFDDPDGMRFAIVESGASAGYAGGEVDGSHGFAGIDRVEVRVADVQRTGSFLAEALGFRLADERADRLRFVLGDDRSGERLDLIPSEVDPATAMGAGTVHHVAWRVPDGPTQSAVSARVRGAGVGVTRVMDRMYFRSIYFRVPGGVVFEVATDGPGFAVDEPVESLGRALKLPPQYEGRRGEIERHLIALPG
jgi:glyoxalase family protein